jgi:hypothetical protein
VVRHSEALDSPSIVLSSYGSIELPSCPLPASSRATGTFYLI